MIEVSSKEARSCFSTLLNRVAGGEEIIITRRGKRVARLVNEVEGSKKLPSLREFRKTIAIDGKPLSQVVLENRDEERF